MRFGSRFNVNAVNFVTDDGLALQWAGVCSYIGIYLVASRQFKCYYDNCKSRLYRSLVNAMYGLISNTASCEAIYRITKCSVYADPAIWLRSMSCPTDYIDLFPNNDLKNTCAPENISGNFGLLFLRAPYKFQFYFTLLYLLI